MYEQPTETTGANPEAPIGYPQPIPSITVEPMPDKNWLKLTHRDIPPKYITMAEGQAIHLTMAETCAADCDCYHRGYDDGQHESDAWDRYEDGLREGAEQGNLGARA